MCVAHFTRAIGSGLDTDGGRTGRATQLMMGCIGFGCGGGGYHDGGECQLQMWRMLLRDMQQGSPELLHGVVAHGSCVGMRMGVVLRFPCQWGRQQGFVFFEDGFDITPKRERTNTSCNFELLLFYLMIQAHVPREMRRVHFIETVGGCGGISPRVGFQ